ncbi:Nodulation receptor kinase [Rhynchospora pubera]|uniref:non-specific serine/threonine protein kinase n=1 Tax=Rhynchospora pubera TaxID=906938 RepID=A0AAV8F0H2_9POAL|nr:Nodulation receptor kinase [Rhynchospora pubera]
MKSIWRSRSMSSSSGNDTPSQTMYSAKSSDFSNLSSSSVSTFPSSNSTHRRKKNMSAAFLCCLGLEPDDQPNDLPSGASTASTNSDIKRFMKKKMSLQVISGNVKFTWDEILKATRCFSSDLKVGEGGCGVVYRGKLENGKEVAIKRAKKDIDDAQLTNESFQTEIATLQQINHMNLVGFYGYLIFEDEKVIVVEWVPNGNLRQHLDCKFGTVLGFSNRLDIIIDVAHAINYLHTYCEKPLIHRDIKSVNILLTSTLHGKVADFGLAKLASMDANNTIVQTIAKGTPGYIDPEYFRTNQLSSKSDVYSFGVVLVEVITGKRPVERTSKTTAVKWAIAEFYKGNAIDTLDPNLKPDEAISAAVRQIYELASHCLVIDRRKRPTMEECCRTLWNIRKTYNDMIKKETVDN